MKQLLLFLLLFLVSSNIKPTKNSSISKLIIHTTDTDDKFDIGAHEIDVLHRYFNEWENGCGYHYVIRRSGQIEVCRPDYQMGAHVKGANKGTIGIVWVGRNQITIAQYKALKRLLRRLMNTYNLDVNSIFPHNYFDSAKEQNKTCPNIDIDELKKELTHE